ncbi:chlororespiratory reduction protein 7 [Calothrix sp. 336/3]|uniref:chlororespiratory reduction protein 7 n=1 Tax=Calothrix sp. 336/3 TaxID=1337936 RepID=UPI0004E42B51|nr:chlororespiratory reduction protein 7 [Calothrix sp. 336/3]AKG24824.1 hypothetical protein IJ00_24635 [Calothrix sp. 336/3]
MSDSLMYQQEYFVVLETNQPEQFLTVGELIAKLQEVIQNLDAQDLPPDLSSLDSPEAQAQHLVDTSCELDIGPGEYLQWYAVRLEK